MAAPPAQRAARQRAAPAPRQVQAAPEPVAAAPPAVPTFSAPSEDTATPPEARLEGQSERAGTWRARAQEYREQAVAAVARGEPAQVARRLEAQARAADRFAAEANEAVETDTQGDPAVEATQRIRLTPTQRLQLERIAQSPIADKRMQTAALEAMNAPTAGRVETVVEAYKQTLRDRKAVIDRQQKAAGKPVRQTLMQAAADPAMNPVFQERAREAAERLRLGREGAEAQANTIANEYLTRSGEKPMYRLQVGPAGPIMDVADAQRAFTRATSGLPPAARRRVRAVDTVADLPQSLQDDAQRENLTDGMIQGAYADGVAYVVLSGAVSPAQIQETVFHELVGHGGMERVLGAARESALVDIFNRAGGVPGIMQLARQFGVENDLAQYLPQGGDGVLTDQQVAQLTEELHAQIAGKSTPTSRMVRAWLARIKAATAAFARAIGMNGFAKQLQNYSANDVALMVQRVWGTLSSNNVQGGDTGVRYQVAAPIAEAERVGKTAIDAVSNALDAVRKAAGNRTMQVAGRAQVMYVSTLNHIARVFGHLFPVSGEFKAAVDGATNLLENISNINRRRAAISAKFADAFAPTWTAYERMERADPKLAEKLRWLMEVAAYEIDARKTWDQSAWLHDKPNKDKLRNLVREANEKYNQLRQRGYGDVFDNMALFNQTQRYASMATLLHTAMAGEPRNVAAAPQFGVDPMTEFLNEPALTTANITAMRDYWKARFEERLAGGDMAWRKQLAQAQNVQESTLPEKARQEPKAPPHLNLLAKTLRDLRTSAAGLEQHPYFHLGRVGDYFTGFTIKPDPTRTGKRKVPDEAAAERISQAFQDAGFDDFTINTVSERQNVFMRVSTPDELDGLMKVINKLVAAGDIEQGSVSSGHREESAVTAAADAKFLEEAVNRFQASPIFDAPAGATDAEREAAARNKAGAISQLKEAWLNMLPAMSEARVMTKRKVVPGWSRDMMQSYAFRANVGNLALANMATSYQMQSTLGEMRNQLREAEQSPDQTKTDDTIRMWQVLNEVLVRENTRPTAAKRDFIDSFRAVNYAFFLGMSPAYALNNLTQVYVTLWPELSKQYGFVKSARAIASAMGQSMKIVGLAAREGWQSSLRQAAEPAITQSVLQRAGADTATQDYILRLTNTGVVDIGAAARELGRLSESNADQKLDNVLRVASAFGLYSEATVRLASALALRELNSTKPEAKRKSDADLVPDAVRIIDDTMFNYTEANVGRALGRTGIAGRYTPVATAFQQFAAQMLEKMYREIADVVGQARPGETAEQRAVRRKEGVKFLGTHAAAMTVLAGSLGLPFVTAIAVAVNGLKDLFDDDDQPYDVQAAWRNFLSTTLGTDLGEIAARGVPRALGADLSSRVGEQDLIPLSRFFADRRKWEDAAPDQAMRMLGAPWSMVGNVASGMREMANGNVLAGLQRAMPTAIRSPIEAYRLGTQGFQNDQGVPLPIEGGPGAAAILVRALGYTPAQQAEYQEANRTQQQFRGVVTREAANIRARLATAIERGDTDAARDWLRQAREFDQNNPAYAILPRLGSTIQQRAVARARADALDVPLGISMRDIAARERTAFANF